MTESLNNKARNAIHKDRTETYSVVKTALDKYDLMGLLAFGAPSDEYVSEAEIIEYKINKDSRRDWFYLRNLVAEVFTKQFDETPDRKLCGKVASDIVCGISDIEYRRDFTENEVLRDKVELFDDRLIRLKIHDGFIVEYFYEKAKANVNGKYFCEIEEQDIVDTLCELCQNDMVYVQYKQKHFVRFYCLIMRSYFKAIPRCKFAMEKLRHKEDIERVFDKNGIIYEA